MGSGSFSSTSFYDYSRSTGKSVDTNSGRVSGQEYKARSMDALLNPKNVTRECCNSEEHPNTVPVILALDVTGSMGAACKETAEALGVIMTDLYKKFKDVQIMVMGIGDLAYDRAPIQISQFESDVRIAEWLDKIYMEHGGGGNGYESYTAAWYMGSRHCKLDCWNQGRKGIIITMGDEPLNPYLPAAPLNAATGDHVEGKGIETTELYKEAIKKYDIFHIAIEDRSSSYDYYKEHVDDSFKKVLGERYFVSTIQKLGDTICKCIENSVENKSIPDMSSGNGISW